MTLRGCAQPLCEAYDAALLDLDGVVYRGTEPVPGAAAAVAAARAAGMEVAFVTNNASRTPEAVVAHLASVGVPARADEVATAAQAAATLLRSHVPAGARVLVTGGEGLRVAVAAAGFAVVASAVDAPAAVVQGYDAGLGYADLAEAALAVRRGATWVASNLDATIPTARGELPGNGALVALVAHATGRRPDATAGKPERALHEESVRRVGARRPIVVGDRLDTDVEGANRVGCDSLLVLTGVTDEAALLAAPPERRPTYVGRDLGALLVAHPPDDGLAGLRERCAAAWAG
ncbi:MAG TPA: HAD-IIA family hydrolase [Mycobacteriales bacterium]|nr:HAD-IIA family hydrolase [Mycobacteriales bacterium]